MNLIRYISLLATTVLIVGLTGYIRFNNKGQQLPEGCDQFGFLYMAEAIDSDKLFKSHTNRPFSDSLITHLKESGFAYESFAWSIAPHAYHLDPATQEIINQYPPGTSYLLSFLSKWNRQYFFASLMLMLMIAIPGGALCWIVENSTEFNRGILFLLLMGLYAITSSPMLTELGRINSVAPTFGLLIAAGILFEKKPLAALWLISLSCVFRLPNILLLPLLCIYVLFGEAQRTSISFEKLFRQGLKITLSILFSGVGLYFLYVYVLLGNPFLSTYSEIDQRAIGWETALDNAQYYFVKENSWLWINLICLIGIAFLRYFKMISVRFFWSLTLTCVAVYAFFLFHFIRTPYYPYAPSLLFAGVIVHQLSKHQEIRLPIPRFLLPIVLLVFVVISVVHFQQKPDKIVGLTAQQDQYRSHFEDVDILWGDLHSSTFEYATGKPGMRLTWGSPRAVLETMTWLQKHNYSQAVLLQDFTVQATEINQFLLPFKNQLEIKEDRIFGGYLVIHPLVKP